jgi:predicted RNA binding protein YcfA (HicA-like mRNA interferase family)
MAKLAPTPWKEFEKFLLFVGCTFERQKGSHRVYSKPGLPRPIIVPTYKSLPVFVLKNNLRLLGMSQKQYTEIMKRL